MMTKRTPTHPDRESLALLLGLGRQNRDTRRTRGGGKPTKAARKAARGREGKGRESPCMHQARLPKGLPKRPKVCPTSMNPKPPCCHAMRNETPNSISQYPRSSGFGAIHFHHPHAARHKQGDVRASPASASARLYRCRRPSSTPTWWRTRARSRHSTSHQLAFNALVLVFFSSPPFRHHVI